MSLDLKVLGNFFNHETPICRENLKFLAENVGFFLPTTSYKNSPSNYFSCKYIVFTKYYTRIDICNLLHTGSEEMGVLQYSPVSKYETIAS